MTEPFLPRHRHDDSIDAADPGLGSPGHDSTEAPTEEGELDAQVEAFEQRLDSERDNDTVFRTPTPNAD